MRCQGTGHSSEGEFEANPEYPEYEAGLEGQETEGYRLYRYAAKGLVVYDSKARYSDSQSPCVQMPLQPRTISNDIRKDLDHFPDYGISLSRQGEIPQFPALPCLQVH